MSERMVSNEELIGYLDRLPIFKVNWKTFDRILYPEDAVQWGMNEKMVEVKKGGIVYTERANPCLAGACIVGQNFYLFHSMGLVLPEGIIKAKRGLVGGSKEQLNEYKTTLKQLGFIIMEPPSSDHAFNVAVIRRKNFFSLDSRFIPQGIYCCYTSLFYEEEGYF